jgi:DNA/RNA endonuclease YhcR with UshA esterase domain
MQLPSYEKDHSELDNGEDINCEYPDSFCIPGKEARESLQPGDIVKLIFRMEETKGSEEISVERMWVEVFKKHENFYEGVLDSDPAGSECVRCGQTIYFQPCHVINIYEEKNT